MAALLLLALAQAREIRALRAAIASRQGSDAAAFPRVDSTGSGSALWYPARVRPAWVDRVTSRYVVTIAVAGAVLAWMLLSNLGDNPAGFFCDEAEIGVSTRHLLEHSLPDFQPPLFYQHLSYTQGALPLYAAAPVTAILGLTDFSVRLVSVLWAALAVVVLLLLMRRLRWRNGEIAVILFACTPVFLHLSRVNFGHAPSMFCLCLGLYAYVRARDSGSPWWAVGSGVALGLSVYGNGSYYLAAPALLAGLVVGEAVVSRFSWRSYRMLALTLVATAITWLPVVYIYLTDERFKSRYFEKETTGQPLLSMSRLEAILDNYPKYFDPQYLFTVGETGLPGGWNMRHSVPGAGVLTWIALPLVVAGIVAIFRLGSGTGRVVAVAGLVTMILYPLPDVTTTTAQNPPYTIAIFSTMLFVPLLAGYGVHWISGWARGANREIWSSRVVPIVLLAIILIGAARFFQGPYERYPTVSAEYYGWQFGPRQGIDAFKRDPEGYDQYFLDPDFNDAYIFLDFYLADDPELRAKAAIGPMGRVDWRKQQLFAIRAEKFDALMSSPDLLRRYARVLDVVYYPSGKVALYIVEFSLANDNGTGNHPW